MSVAPPDHLSPSGWSAWEQCPAQWKARYIDGIRDEGGWQAEVGTFAHRVFELLMERDPELRTRDHALAIARELWANPGPLWWDTSGESAVIHDGPLAIPRGEITEARFKSAAWYAIQGLWSLEDPAGVDVVATEERIEWTEGEVPMVAIVDRVDRHPRSSLTPGLVVIDYKTGSVPDEFYFDWRGKRHRSKRREKVKRQITVNAMGVAARLEHRLEVAHTGSLLYVSADEAIGAPTDPRARARAHEAAQEVWEAINVACETEKFKPEPSVLCQWCDVAASCRAGLLHIKRMSEGVKGGYQADSPGAKLVAAAERA